MTPAEVPTGQRGSALRSLATRLLLGSLLLLSPLLVVSCTANGGPSRQSLGCATAATPCLSGPATVAMQTTRGEVQFQLDGRAAPLTAGNFVDLVKRGAYNGTVFHRVVREPTAFVVQGGDPLSANPVVPPTQYGTGNFIDPSTAEARLIPLEIKLTDEAKPRYGEPITAPGVTRQLDLPHQRGALAMARSNDPNSASAQFYVALQALPELDGRYAVFGRVSQGMEVIDRIQQGDKIIKATLVSGGKLVQGD
ncbi:MULTISPECIES: peptidylprolyl isomerase [Aphanothece]|uniref:peptidylprolyl isomerase n=1 Tax=Aphanothece TaxID=1121 RepID=UPI00398E8A3E